MYINTLTDILQAAKLFPVVPNHTIVNGTCSCGKADCQYRGKHPYLSNGFLGASQSEDDIRKWHHATGGIMNIGFRMGNGHCVFDVDPRNGGDESYNRLVKEYGPLPRTPKAITGGDGFHLYFRDPFKLKKFSPEEFPGIDIQAEGSQVIAPPSLHLSGKVYKWELAPVGIEAGVEQVPFAPLPEWVLELLPASSIRRASAVSVNRTPSAFTFDLPPADISTAEGVGEGQRHGKLLELVGREIGRGREPEQVLALAMEWNEKNDPPLPEAEVRRQVNALARKQGRKTAQQSLSLRSSASEDDGGESGNLSEPEMKVTLPSSTVPPPGAAGERQRGGVVSTSVPCLHPDAFHGLIGAITHTIAPETEADLAAVLISLLAAVGSAVGPGPCAQAGADRHAANTFALLVGPTTARKGASESIVMWLMERAVPTWVQSCATYGLGTGEGLAERLQDGRYEEGPDGKPMFVSGTTDKRLMAVEREFASVLKKGRREGNTLSDMLRNAFDGKPLEVVNRKKNSLKATGHHVSIIGHITAEELAENLKGSEVANGFLNRFLLVAVSRSKKLPSGGNIAVLEPFVRPLQAAIARAGGDQTSVAVKPRHLKRTPEAERLWAEWYCTHSEHDGLVGKVTARAEAHALRLSLIYALVDGATAIGVEHLRAALAVWNYCEASAVALFGKMNGGGTTILSSKLLQAIRIKPGILRSELWDVVGHKLKAEELTASLNSLEITGQAYHQTEGRREMWFPCGKAEGGKPEAASGPDDSPVRVSTFHLPPDEGVQTEGEDSTLHCFDDFVTELAASRPARAASEATPPQADAVPEQVWFGFSEPLPEGWLDGVNDAARIERVWPVPEGWYRSPHGLKWGERDERGISGRNVFNPAWPIKAHDPLEWDFDDDPTKTIIVMPQAG
jgi:hypothetical protein